MWDAKPADGSPVNWVELKTSADIRNERDMITFERKLMKFWIQSFLLGVPKIIVGFRTPDGFLKRIEEMDTASIPGAVKRAGKGTWDGNMCINFASALLDCEYPSFLALGSVPNSRFSLEGDRNRRWSLEDSKERAFFSDRGVQDRGDWSWRHPLGRVY